MLPRPTSLRYDLWGARRVPHRQRGSHIPGTSQDEDGIPDPPPVPPNLASAIAALVNVTIENARLLREIA